MRSSFRLYTLLFSLILHAPLVTAMATSRCAVFGCGVLGTSLCKQLLESPELSSYTEVVGVTKTDNNHEKILEAVGDTSGRFRVATFDQVQTDEKFTDVVFCAPPSGFEDYPAAVDDVATNLWAGLSEGGTFVFTSSGGVYGFGEDGMTVSESTPTADPESSPRIARAVGAEQSSLRQGGCVLRLAGLYNLERGAHNFWLTSGKPISGRADGIINQLHYDDAASSCIAALKVGSSVVEGRAFLISDGNPMTRQEICESAMKAAPYAGNKVELSFLGTDKDPKGKIYDGSVSNADLKWSPKYESFDAFMNLHVP